MVLCERFLRPLLQKLGSSACFSSQLLRLRMFFTAESSIRIRNTNTILLTCTLGVIHEIFFKPCPELKFINRPMELAPLGDIDKFQFWTGFEKCFLIFDFYIRNTNSDLWIFLSGYILSLIFVVLKVPEGEVWEYDRPWDRFIAVMLTLSKTLSGECKPRPDNNQTADMQIHFQK